MIINQAQLSDLGPLTTLVDEYRTFHQTNISPGHTQAYLEKHLQQGAVNWLVARDVQSQQLMGFVSLFPSYSTLALEPIWILNELGVSSHFRGKGVAKALISHAMTFATETGAIRIELKTSMGNHNARALYKTLGFEIDEGNVYYRVPMT